MTMYEVTYETVNDDKTSIQKRKFYNEEMAISETTFVKKYDLGNGSTITAVSYKKVKEK